MSERFGGFLAVLCFSRLVVSFVVSFLRFFLRFARSIVAAARRAAFFDNEILRVAVFLANLHPSPHAI